MSGLSTRIASIALFALGVSVSVPFQGESAASAASVAPPGPTLQDLQRVRARIDTMRAHVQSVLERARGTSPTRCRDLRSREACAAARDRCAWDAHRRICFPAPRPEADRPAIAVLLSTSVTLDRMSNVVDEAARNYPGPLYAANIVSACQLNAVVRVNAVHGRAVADFPPPGNVQPADFDELEQEARDNDADLQC